MFTEILTKTGQTGAVAGNWFAIKNPRHLTHLPLSIAITAGTATVVIEGRLKNGSVTPVTLDSTTASKGFMIAAFNEIRINVTAAAGATITARIADAANDVGA